MPRKHNPSDRERCGVWDRSAGAFCQNVTVANNKYRRCAKHIDLLLAQLRSAGDSLYKLLTSPGTPMTQKENIVRVLNERDKTRPHFEYGGREDELIAAQEKGRE